MRCIFLVILFAASGAATCTAQIICVPGSAAVGPWLVDEDPGPPEPLTSNQIVSPWSHGNYARSRHQYLFLASELDLLLNPDLTAGLCPGEPIEGISFWVNSNITLANQKNYAWRMLIKHSAQITLTGFDNNVDPAAQCVLSGGGAGTPQAQPAPGASGWRTFTFPSPFIWNGMDNLIIEFCYATTTTNVAQPTIWCTIPLPFNGSYSRYGTSVGTCANNGACGAVNIAGCGMDDSCGGGGASNQRPVVLFSGIVSTLATGITQQEDDDLTVQHDPVGGWLHLTAGGKIGEVPYALFDAQGRLISNGIVYRRAAVDLNSFATGLYTVTLGDGSLKRVERFVVR